MLSFWSWKKMQEKDVDILEKTSTDRYVTLKIKSNSSYEINSNNWVKKDDV